MNSKTVFYLMSVLIGVTSLLVIGAAIIGNAKLQESADEMVDLKLENHLLEAQQTALVKAKKDIEANQELVAIAQTVVPQEKDQARTVREIINLANAADIPITNITFPTSELGQLRPAPSPIPDEDQDDEPAPSAPPAPAVTQVQPVQGIPGVYQMEINVRSDSNRPVPYGRFIRFLELLEQNRRTAQVTNISVLPSQDTAGAVTFSLVVNVFIKP